MAEKLNKANGPVQVYLPEQGVSAVDRTGQPLFDPEANEAMYDELESRLHNEVPVIRVNAHINDPDFGERAANGLKSIMDR
jgi:uncharacterized protein (UPF0261 family)